MENKLSKAHYVIPELSLIKIGSELLCTSTTPGAALTDLQFIDQSDMWN